MNENSSLNTNFKSCPDMYSDSTDMSVLPNSEFCKVRFLNAAEGYGPFCIFIGSMLVGNNLKYSNMTQYSDIRDGFKTVTIVSHSSKMILYRREIPFNSGDVVTLSIIKTFDNIDVICISDMYSLNNIGNMGGIRMANLVYDSPPFSLLISNRKSIFSDVMYKQTTMFKRAKPKEYKFYLTQTYCNINCNCDNIEICDDKTWIFPSISQNIAEFFLDIKPNTMYTIYVIGNWSKPMLIKVVDNL